MVLSILSIIIWLILTNLAWREGWRWYSLIPLTTIYITALVLGCLLEIAGNEDILLWAKPAYILIIFTVYVILGTMAYSKREPDVKSQNHKNQRVKTMRKCIDVGGAIIVGISIFVALVVLHSLLNGNGILESLVEYFFKALLAVAGMYAIVTLEG